MAGSKLGADIFKRYSRLHHQNGQVVYEVGDFVDGLRLVLGLGRDDYLGGFLADLFKDLVQSLFKKICGVGAFLFLDFAPLYKLVKQSAVMETMC